MGTLALGYLEQLVKFGAPTRARVPYPELATTEADCDYLNTIQDQADFPDSYPAMQRFQIGSYAVFHIEDNSQAVSLTKEFIANGQAVAFSGSVLCGYCTPVPLQNGVIYETEYKAGSGHGQLVVGYNDDIGVPGKKGALLIQNSFGTAWPPASSQSPAPPGKVLLVLQQLREDPKAGRGRLPTIARAACGCQAFPQPARPAGFDHPVFSVGAR
jgi:hypothetical protein